VLVEDVGSQESLSCARSIRTRLGSDYITDWAYRERGTRAGVVLQGCGVVAFPVEVCSNIPGQGLPLRSAGQTGQDRSNDANPTVKPDLTHRKPVSILRRRRTNLARSLEEGPLFSCTHENTEVIR